MTDKSSSEQRFCAANSKNKVRGETMRQRDERIKRGGKRYLERLVRDKEAKEQIKDYKDEDRT